MRRAPGDGERAKPLDREPSLKKSTAIRLTLASTLVLGAGACSSREEQPTQTLRGYCHPDDETWCEDRPRAGFVPVFFPMYWGGYYYDNRGVARTSPGGPIARGAPVARVSRGGFGATGAGRSTGS